MRHKRTRVLHRELLKNSLGIPFVITLKEIEVPVKDSFWEMEVSMMGDLQELIYFFQLPKNVQSITGHFF